jgi:hypothetical protein
MSDITPESPHYRLCSLVICPDSSTLSIVDQHSRLERKRPLPVLLAVQYQQLLAQREFPTWKHELLS